MMEGAAREKRRKWQSKLSRQAYNIRRGLDDEMEL